MITEASYKCKPNYYIAWKLLFQKIINFIIY